MWKNIRRWQQALVSRPGWAVFNVVKRAKLNEKDPHIEPDRARDYNRDIDLRLEYLGYHGISTLCLSIACFRTCVE